MDRYCFSDIATSHDHTLAIGNTVLLKFTMQGLAPEQQFQQMHGIHIYDPSQLKDQNAVLDLLSKYQIEPLNFLNDFEVPFVSLKRKFPRLQKKRKIAKRFAGEDDDDEPSQEDDNDDENEEEDDEKDDEGGGKKSDDEDVEEEDEEQASEAKNAADKSAT